MDLVREISSPEYAEMDDASEVFDPSSINKIQQRRAMQKKIFSELWKLVTTLCQINGAEVTNLI